MKKMLVSLPFIFSFCTLSNATNEYDLRSNMFYENHFWKDRKLTDQELNQAIIFITEILRETKEGQGMLLPELLTGSKTLQSKI